MRARPISEADLEILRAWRNDARVRAGSFASAIISEAEQRAWYARRKSDPAYSQFIIDGVGSFSFTAGEAGVASIGYYAAPGTPPGAGSTLMGEALRIAPGLGFNQLIADVLADNERSIGLVEKFGYVKDGGGERDGKPYVRYRKVLQH